MQNLRKSPANHFLFHWTQWFRVHFFWGFNSHIVPYSCCFAFILCMHWRYSCIPGCFCGRHGTPNSAWCNPSMATKKILIMKWYSGVVFACRFGISIVHTIGRADWPLPETDGFPCGSGICYVVAPHYSASFKHPKLLHCLRPFAGLMLALTQLEDGVNSSVKPLLDDCFNILSILQWFECETYTLNKLTLHKF